MSPGQSHRNQPRQNSTDSRLLLPTTPVEGGSKYARRAATTTKATRKNKILSSVVRDHQDARRYPSSPEWDSQITLTQLVPKTETPGEVETGQHDIEVIDLVEEDDDSSYRPSNRHRSPSSIPTTKFKKRKSVGIAGSTRKTAKPVRGKNEKNQRQNGKNGNKTLTQMDFVRRYIPLPESDDDNLKLYGESLPALNDNEVDAEEQHNDVDHLLTPRKRRKLNNNGSVSPTVKKTSSPDQKAELLLRDSTPTPKTPQRIHKFEIPSSQTPETPRTKVIPSPNLRKVRRSSLGVQSLNIAERNLDQSPKGRSHNTPSATQGVSPHDEYMTTENTVIDNDDPLKCTTTTNSQPQRSPTQTNPLSSRSAAIQSTHQPPEPPPIPLKERGIVYDTDAETDYGDVDDDNGDYLPQSSAVEEASDSWANQTDSPSKYRSTVNGIESDDLPPIPNSGTDLEINTNNFSDPALASESSVYYRRPAQCTQYPNEPVPMMNTQKIAELFPIEEEAGEPHSSRIETSTSSPKQPPISSANLQPHIFRSQSEPPAQDDYGDKSIQIVPESSPVTRNEADVRPAAVNTMAPPPRESIVLVESSQLVDRLSRQNESSHTGASLRRLFSTSEFLTDSVMETIPPPPWMLSQDSVGEPYSGND